MIEAVRRELDRGSNFVRPSIVEVEAAERFLATVPTAEMVKFAKNGSDATTAAVQPRPRRHRAPAGGHLRRPSVLLRSTTGSSAPTPMSAGIPGGTAELTVAFPYGDLAATEELLTRYQGEVACLILEPADPHRAAARVPRRPARAGRPARRVLIFDEMITGFRWSEAGAQGLYGVVARPLHVRQGAGQRVRRLRAGRAPRADGAGRTASLRRPGVPAVHHARRGDALPGGRDGRA